MLVLPEDLRVPSAAWALYLHMNLRNLHDLLRQQSHTLRLVDRKRHGRGRWSWGGHTYTASADPESLYPEASTASQRSWEISWGCVERKSASGVGRFRLDSRKNLCWQGSEGKVNHEVRKEGGLWMGLLGPLEDILPHHCTHNRNENGASTL